MTTDAGSPSLPPGVRDQLIRRLRQRLRMIEREDRAYRLATVLNVMSDADFIAADSTGAVRALCGAYADPESFTSLFAWEALQKQATALTTSTFIRHWATAIIRQAERRETRHD